MWLEEKFDRARAWVDLLILACHKEESVKIRKRMILLKSGQLCYSKKSLGKRWHWDRRTVTDFLDVLESSRMVYTQNAGVTTIITIVNWNRYQANVQVNVHDTVHKQEYKNKEVIKIPNFPKC